MRLGQIKSPSRHRTLWILCILFCALSSIPATAARSPLPSTIIYPTTILNDTTLAYSTTIQYRTNWEGKSDIDYHINTFQNWTIDVNSNLHVDTKLIPNVKLSNGLSQTVSYNYIINSTSNEAQNRSSEYPTALQGTWEHCWPTPANTTYAINDQEVSLIFNIGRQADNTFYNETKLTYNQTTITVEEYHTNYVFTVGCG